VLIVRFRPCKRIQFFTEPGTGMMIWSSYDALPTDVKIEKEVLPK
jgi:hypothetical protein